MFSILFFSAQFFSFQLSTIQFSTLPLMGYIFLDYPVVHIAIIIQTAKAINKKIRKNETFLKIVVTPAHISTCDSNNFRKILDLIL